MNYLKIYCNLVRKAENRTLTTCYIEKHHVFPISIYGKTTRIVKFTYREHFVAHRLLAKICANRYGEKDNRTRKMKMAIHRMVYTMKKPNIKHNSLDYEIARRAIKESKTGKKRPDCVGKSYFGASEETIKTGIEKMRIKKTGMKFPDRKMPSNAHLRTDEWHNNISKGRQKTLEKYLAMTEEDFWIWVYKQQKYRTQKNSTKKCINPNITRAMIIRGIPLKEYYNLDDYNKSWLRRKNNKELFYGL